LELQYTDTPAAESADQTLTAPNEASGLLETAEGRASDMVAVMLSILPGLGHIYKGYRLIGVLLMFVGAPMAVALALLIATGTAGFGFFLLPVYWIAVMVHVWAIPDRVAPTISDEGEQY
jgi:apolipoprotein N-acyltransferase